MKKSKVFVGVNNIAGIAKYTADALKEIGIHAKSFSFNKHPFGYACDKEDILYKAPTKRSFVKKMFINKYSVSFFHGIQRFNLFFKSIFLFDTFIFISVNTIFLHQFDLLLLKLLKKKIAFIFVGCPERNPFDNYNLQQESFCSFCSDEKLKHYLKCDKPEDKQKKIRKIEKYADFIFSQKDTTGFLQHPENVKYFYILANTAVIYNADKFDKEKIRITHFPSNTLFKGTKYVNRAIEKLDSSKIEYFSQRISNEKVKDELMNANILIDQFAHGYGLLATEAMARGCVVICRTTDWFRHDYPDMPIISCEPEELADTLSELIDDRVRMKQLAKEGVAYSKKVHSLKGGGEYYKKILNLK